MPDTSNQKPDVADTEKIAAQFVEVRKELLEQHRQGDIAGCMRLAHVMLELARSIDAPVLISSALLEIGNNHLDDEERLRLYHESLEMSRKAGSREGEVAALSNIGLTHYMNGRHSEALPSFQMALGRLDDTVRLQLHASINRSLASVHLSLGHSEQFMHYAHEALRIATTRETAEIRASLLRSIAKFLLEEENVEEALRYAVDAVETLSATGTYPNMLALCLQMVAHILLQLERVDEAIEHGRHALEVAARQELHRYSSGAWIRTYYLLGEAHDMRGEADQALEYLLKGQELAERFEDHLKYCMGLHAGGRHHLQYDRADEAINMLEKALEYANIHVPESHGTLMGIHNDLYHAYSKAGRYREALEQHEVFRTMEKKRYSEEANDRFQQLAVDHELARHERDAEIQRLRAEKLQADLERKQQELASTAMHLARQTEMLGRFRNDLRAIARDIPITHPGVHALKEKLKELPCESIDWTKFEAEFQQTYPEFRSMLQQKYPELTKTELRVCALLRLKLISADIANLLCVSERNVESHRYRIRKKLELTREQDLADVLAGI